MNTLKNFAVAALAIFGLTGAASAATVTSGSKGVTITCALSCDVWDIRPGADGFDPAIGDWLSGAYGGIGNGNGNAARLAFVNTILGTAFSAQSESSDRGAPGSALAGFSGGGNGGWTGSSRYYLAWGGGDPRYVLIRNDSADNVFSWDQTGKGSGLSGVDGFGAIPSAVPLPAAGFLLLAGLGGLTALRRKAG